MNLSQPATSCDVLIVGAGPTGLVLANLLGTMGVSTLLVERNAGTVDQPRAVSIDDESMRVMQAMGLADAVAAITVCGYGSIYKGPSGRVFATVKPTSLQYGFHKRNAFQQPELEAVLRAGLERFASVTALFSTELLDFAQDRDRVSARLKTGQGDRRVAAKYLVACDGGRSGVRKALGIEFSGSTFEEPWLIVDLKHSQNRCFHTEVFCDPARPCITLPGPGGIRRYEFKLGKTESASAATEEAFVRRLLRGCGPDGDEDFRRVQVYTFHARLAESWRVGRAFVAGDAAHLTPPFAGQGMNSGLRDAHNLAWKLALALQRGASEDLLNSYEAERKPHARSMIGLAERMGEIMMPSSRLKGALVRGLGHVLALYPPAKSYFAEMKYKPQPRHGTGLVWPDKRPARASAIGRMIPQPLVADPDRRLRLLDDVAGDGVVALVFSERPDLALAARDLLALRAAGVQVVGLTPEWSNPVAFGFPIVRDQSRFFSEPPYAGYLEHVLLLRRDRYVAATRPVARAGELVAFAAFLGAPKDEHQMMRAGTAIL